ncbi:MAG: hypothetical protein H0T47_06145 [Planctomycetaceae bacterium]|nr:hypothetical protein [Planctomycetaceae bacterium]
MLDTDYSELFRILTNQVAWNIDLPGDRDRFLRDTGHAASVPGDERRSPRLRIRTPCLLIPESPLPAFPRTKEPLAVYTVDLSRDGVGFLAAVPFLSAETIRIVLPVFWLQATIVRGRRGPPLFSRLCRADAKAST